MVPRLIVVDKDPWDANDGSSTTSSDHGDPDFGPASPIAPTPPSSHSSGEGPGIVPFHHGASQGDNREAGDFSDESDYSPGPMVEIPLASDKDLQSTTSEILTTAESTTMEEWLLGYESDTTAEVTIATNEAGPSGVDKRDWVEGYDGDTTGEVTLSAGRISAEAGPSGVDNDQRSQIPTAGIPNEEGESIDGVAVATTGSSDEAGPSDAGQGDRSHSAPAAANRPAPSHAEFGSLSTDDMEFDFTDTDDQSPPCDELARLGCDEPPCDALARLGCGLGYIGSPPEIATGKSPGRPPSTHRLCPPQCRAEDRVVSPASNANDPDASWRRNATNTSTTSSAIPEVDCSQCEESSDDIPLQPGDVVSALFEGDFYPGTVISIDHENDTARILFDGYEDEGEYEVHLTDCEFIGNGEYGQWSVLFPMIVGIPDEEDDHHGAPYTPYQSEEGEAGPSGSMVDMEEGSDAENTTHQSDNGAAGPSQPMVRPQHPGVFYYDGSRGMWTCHFPRIVEIISSNINSSRLFIPNATEAVADFDDASSVSSIASASGKHEQHGSTSGSTNDHASTSAQHGGTSQLDDDSTSSIASTSGKNERHGSRSFPIDDDNLTTEEPTRSLNEGLAASPLQPGDVVSALFEGDFYPGTVISIDHENDTARILFDGYEDEGEYEVHLTDCEFFGNGEYGQMNLYEKFNDVADFDDASSVSSIASASGKHEQHGATSGSTSDHTSTSAQHGGTSQLDDDSGSSIASTSGGNEGHGSRSFPIDDDDLTTEEPTRLLNEGRAALPAGAGTSEDHEEAKTPSEPSLILTTTDPNHGLPASPIASGNSAAGPSRDVEEPKTPSSPYIGQWIDREGIEFTMTNDTMIMMYGKYRVSFPWKEIGENKIAIFQNHRKFYGNLVGGTIQWYNGDIWNRASILSYRIREPDLILHPDDDNESVSEWSDSGEGTEPDLDITDDEYVIYYPGNGWTGDSGWTPNEDEQESFEAVRDESRDESRNILRIHLLSYREQTIGHGARPTFRGWLQSIHPENVRQGIIDPRLLLPRSEHLQIWNEVFPNRLVVGRLPRYMQGQPGSSHMHAQNASDDSSDVESVPSFEEAGTQEQYRDPYPINRMLGLPKYTQGQPGSSQMHAHDASDHSSDVEIVPSLEESGNTQDQYRDPYPINRTPASSTTHGAPVGTPYPYVRNGPFHDTTEPHTTAESTSSTSSTPHPKPASRVPASDDPGAFFCVNLQRMAQGFHDNVIMKIGICFQSMNSRTATLVARVGDQIYKETVTLPFDAASKIARYQIDWKPGNIVWFADKQPIGALNKNISPVPDQSMRIKLYVAPKEPTETPTDLLIEHQMQLFSVGYQQYQNPNDKTELFVLGDPENKVLRYVLYSSTIFLILICPTYFWCKRKAQAPHGYIQLEDGEDI